MRGKYLYNKQSLVDITESCKPMNNIYIMDNRWQKLIIYNSVKINNYHVKSVK